ncbi:MAG TPA: hypothetical protein VKR30_08070 [Candidatus Limnocylindrales bacterium]|nr:hypothetical protein [Candidatus Limnocylindrales bacterium]
MSDAFGDPWGSGPGADGTAGALGAPGEANEAYLELIGTHLRASGVADVGRFRRISDYVNLLDGFFRLRDVVLLDRTGAPTRITLPELRVRLDDVAIVGQLVVAPLGEANDGHVVIPKQMRRLVVMTRAHIIYGYAFIHESGGLIQFVDSTDPKFIPMANVRVRWLADRRLAGRYPFALIQRSQILGVATEGTGAPKAARARRKAAVAAAEAAMAEAADSEETLAGAGTRS